MGENLMGDNLCLFSKKIEIKYDWSIRANFIFKGGVINRPPFVLVEID